MGRRRIRGKGLPTRVYPSNGWLFYVHPETGKWHKLAREGEISAMHRALADVIAGDKAGTMGALFARYRKEILPGKAPMTQRVQEKELQRLEAVFGRMAPDDITPQMVGQYLTERSAPVAANREMALLSHVFTKGVSRWYMAERNPCLGVERNAEKPRRHSIVGADLMRAWLIAKPWMRALMAIAYVGGQRKMDVATVKDTDFGARGLTVLQGKTGTQLLLRWTKGLRWARDFALSVRPVAPIGRWLVCNARGQHYTDRTIRREWGRVMDELERQGGARFQFRDIRAASSTDHETGEHLGHRDPRVNERHYRLGPKVVRPL